MSTNILIYSASLILIFAGLGCSKPIIQSHWATDIVIDGEISDWHATPISIAEGKITAMVTNTGSHLNVLLTCDDTMWINRILRTGFTLWIDPDGRKEKFTGIVYPMGWQVMGIPMRGTATRESRETRHKQLLELHKDMMIITTPLNRRSLIPVEKSIEHGLAIKMDISDDHLAYELRFPLDSELVITPILPDAETSISIGFEFGGETHKKLKPGKSTGSSEYDRGMSQGGGKGSGGGKKAGGMGRGGGKGSGSKGSGNKITPSESEIHWINVRLTGSKQAPDSSATAKISWESPAVTEPSPLQSAAQASSALGI